MSKPSKMSVLSEPNRPRLVQMIVGLLLALAVLASACGGSAEPEKSGASESAGADGGSAGDSSDSGGLDEGTKNEIADCMTAQIQDPAIQQAIETQDTTSLADEQIQATLAVVASCSAEGLGLSDAATSCVQKAFASAIAAYPDVRALADEAISGGDTSALEQTVMQAAMNPAVCTPEERQAMLNGPSTGAAADQ